MDTKSTPRDDTIRFSNSPRRSTQVIESIVSPVRSIHPEQMESIHSQADYTHRTTDFFSDDSSGEEAGKALGDPDLDFAISKGSPAKRKRPPPSAQCPVSQCEPKHVLLSSENDTCPILDSNVIQKAASPSLHSPSFDGSVDELNLVQDRHPNTLAAPKRARLSQNSLRASHYSQHNDHSGGFAALNGGKEDVRVGVHFLAHEFLLRGMLADTELVQSPAATTVTSRLSGVQPSILHQQLPTSLSDNMKETGLSTAFLTRPASTSSLVPNKKKVHLVPPPIEITGSNGMPDNFVRTPYPFPQRTNRKDFELDPTSRSGASHAGLAESILTLSIRKHNPNSRTRITTVSIPTSNDYAAIRSSQNGAKEQYFRAAIYDDEQFFFQLRQAYIHLVGPWRFLLARRLTRIVVSVSATRGSDAGYGWIHQPRSPQILAYKGLNDTFSEEKILESYQRPALGRSRYAFVHWAHRLAAAPLSRPAERTSQEQLSPGLVRKAEQPEGLEFVVSWSISRILLVFMAVIVLSVAAMLIWIFLGKNSVPPGLPIQGAGYLNAGDRVGVGILIGICVFLIGSGGMAGWIGISWLAM